MTAADEAFACMAVFAATLAERGVSEVALSPGSRSTPIALAVAREPRLQVHVHLDERASAFFALGVAKATGRPAAVVCTSGTAAANLFPAVVEASMARVPLLLLTADRPPELRGVGANQTIDQLELFGRYARWFVDAEVPHAGAGAGRTWVGLAKEVLARADGPPPGPVHVNLPFREPLVPAGEPVELGDGGEHDPLDPRAATLRQPSLEDVAALREAFASERGVLVAGSLRASAVPMMDLAARRGWPLIAEPTSRLRVPGSLSAAQFLLAEPGFARKHRADVVVQIGAAPTALPALSFVAAAERLLIVDPDGLVADPGRRAERRVVADPGSIAARLMPESPEARDRTWLDAWTLADAVARRAVDELLDSWEAPFEGRVARDVAAWLPDGSTLVVGSSMPVRDLDAYMTPRRGVKVLANRGASGIDGFVSTVLGVSLGGRPTFALCGDLTLLHDAGSLIWSAARGYDAVFVVPNNNGGGIFPFLPQRELPELEPLFVTPHELDLAAVCAAAGAGHERVERADELVPALERGAAVGGVRLVEVAIDRGANVRRHAEVTAAVAEAVAAR